MSERFPTNTPNPHERVDFVRYDAAHRRALEVVKLKMKGRELPDFIGGPAYTKEMIAETEEKIENYHIAFKAENSKKTPEQLERNERSKMLAESLEGIFMFTRSWFGPAAKLYPTTEWDDIVHGVDMVAERSEGGLVDHSGFALDVTFAGQQTINKKVHRLAERLKNGKLAQVDFFKSDDGRFKGQLGEIPLVVVGADGNTMKGLVNLFADHKDQELAEHPFQFQLIDQVLTQCDVYMELGSKIPEPEKALKVVNAYRKLKETFSAILKTKDKSIPHVDREFRDNFHQNLLLSLENASCQTVKQVHPLT